MTEMQSIRTLIIEVLDNEVTMHYREILLHVKNIRQDVKEHSSRARLSEAASRQEVHRLSQGVYSLYKETALTSVVSYPERGPWGDARYRGNCSGFLIKDLLLRFQARRVFDPMEGSGTARDVVAGINQHTSRQISYTGKDLHAGFNLVSDPVPGRFDFIWWHPPYADMIRYSGNPGDLSTCPSYQEYLHRMRQCLEKLHDALLPGGVLALLIGDLRRQGTFTPIFHDILQMQIGELKSIIIKVQHHTASSRKTYQFSSEERRKWTIPIAHEYCLLFGRQMNRCPPLTLP